MLLSRGAAAVSALRDTQDGGDQRETEAFDTLRSVGDLLAAERR